MITAEEFFRNKIKELHPYKEVVTLSQELITAEQGLRWAHEFKQLHLHGVVRGGANEAVIVHGDNTITEDKSQTTTLTTPTEPLGNEAVAKGVARGHDPEVVKRMWEDESKYGNRAFE